MKPSALFHHARPAEPLGGHDLGVLAAPVAARRQHEHDDACGHHHQVDIGLLSGRERFLLGTRLVLALGAVGLLVLAWALRWLRPGEAELAQWVAMAAALLVGVPVFSSALRSLRSPGLHGTTDLLVAMALIAAWMIGDLETAALVPLAMVIGHAIEERSLLGSQEALAALTGLTRGQARRLDAQGAITTVDGDRLAPQDRIELRPGDRCPVDGVVDSGRSSIDTAPITGESVPLECGPGDRVLAGGINQGGRLVVVVERIGAETALGRVVALMQDAERSKPDITRLLDRFAGPYLLLVMLTAILLGVATGSATVLMATLVAACPCALVVAAPATAVAAIAAAARRGILVKNTAFLERLAGCDSIIFDKTGTLTEGQLTVLDGDAQGLSPAARRAAAALGRASSHPVAQACAGLDPAWSPAALADVQETSGQGIGGQVDGQAVLLGRTGLLTAQGIAVPPAPAHEGPVVALALGGQWQAWLRLSDRPRAEASEALRELRALGFERQVLCTGDRHAVADAIGAQLGLSEVHAEALPADKLARVRREIIAGHQPVVVGDGINDALALKAGVVGIAVGGRSSDVAAASADIALIDGNLRRLSQAVRLARTCRISILISLTIAAAWTVLIIILAAAGLISPFAAAILHNVGTVAVILNAGRIIAVRG